MSQKNEAREKQKREYCRPELTVHGSVEEITKGGAPGIQDAVTVGSPAPG